MYTLAYTPHTILNHFKKNASCQEPSKAPTSQK